MCKLPGLWNLWKISAYFGVLLQAQLTKNLGGHELSRLSLVCQRNLGLNFGRQFLPIGTLKKKLQPLDRGQFNIEVNGTINYGPRPVMTAIA